MGHPISTLFHVCQPTYAIPPYTMPKVKLQPDSEYKTHLDKAIEALNQPNPVSICEWTLNVWGLQDHIGESIFSEGKTTKPSPCNTAAAD